MKSKLFMIIMVLLLFGVLLFLGVFDTNKISNTKMEFSYDTGTPADSYSEKVIYINSDMEKLELNAGLKIDSGDVTIQVVNTSNNEVVWNENYSADSNFVIEVTDLKADSEYLLTVQATQSKKVKLTVTSPLNLTKIEEKPKKY